MDISQTAISNCTQLQNMKNNLSGSYYLTGDIDCSDTINWNSGAGFEHIGYSADSTNTLPFTGTFDGKGYKITGLYINRPSTDKVGLFGYTSGAEIKNVKLKNANVKGRGFLGIAAGYVASSSILESVTVLGAVNGSSDNIGGLAGYVENSFITKSGAAVNVAGYSNVGGLVGYNLSSSSITNSYAIGSVSGSAYAIG